jgi:hypothetical protein
MPTEEEHIAKAEQNEALFHEFVVSGTHPDWAMTVLFYATLHYVDAWLSRSGNHPQSHVDRRRLVKKNQSLHRIYGHYSRLDERSRDARYTFLQFPANYEQTLYENEYRPIRDMIRNLLGLAP